VTDTDPATLVDRALTGERRAVAKVLSLVEQGGPDAHAAVAMLHARTGKAWTVGMTGAPGAGKSTLTDKLISRMRDEGLEVGVLAVDPTSPFSGGAILGDRVRMQEHSTDPGVFIRSMATRGHLGGLALATPQAIRVLDATGKEWIIVETVGVGQVEVEIAGQADTAVVVVNPGWGDAVQAAKAGLMEIADVFVVNKADRAGANEAVRDLEGMLDLAGSLPWRPPVVCTTATTGDGIDELWDVIRDHRGFLEAEDKVAARRRDRQVAELRAIVRAQLEARADELTRGDGFERLVDDVLARRRDPYGAVDELLDQP
jgi:LAO/AO transport system kinase